MGNQLLYEHIVIASHNTGKISELSDLFKPYSKTITSSKTRGLIEPAECGKSFCENAEVKAVTAAKATGCLAIADDSGLCIDALNGLPGLYTARWAKQSGGYAQAIDHILTRLESDSSRKAKMVCALSFALPSGVVYSFLGEVYGTISWRAKGKNLIGFEPIFIPNGSTKTLAEYSLVQRSMLIPRAKAFHQLLKHLGEREHFVQTPMQTPEVVYAML
ncbi:hypothetical protein L1286_15055 [Pseudoalteromonas sp. SMS1]|uniref:non-canonical purine NTP pyrophosphatase n=1 Tax=Pseudoalteromonas sp. SMS1 TaxID=2908894 RepID=UPI001F372099|nr:non-canonical purine NTP pyrophosphatase [Pseudoalteromonas sp. SMS1]MCF2858803.1 hypothetical protein [Pseudoalteromonas sp. SMS1]